MIVGAFNNLPSVSPAGFNAYQKVFPGALVARFFHPGMPSDISQTQAAGSAAAGVVPFLSVKPSYTNVGSDNAKITSLAKSMPAGSYLAAWHEPENDMTAAQYVAMSTNFYKVAKAANPAINVGNVYMTYQWGPGRNVDKTAGGQNAWGVASAYTDFLGTDTYMDTWQKDASGNPKLLADDLDHQRWHSWAKTRGKPLLLTESGVGQGFTDAQRATYYTENAKWLVANGYRMFLPWNGAGTPPTGENWDFWNGAKTWPLTVAAMQAIAAAGDRLTDPVQTYPFVVTASPTLPADIIAVQSQLGVTADGKYGDQSWAATRDALNERDQLRDQVAGYEQTLSQIASIATVR